MRAYRSGGLPAWQLSIIDRYPLLYRAEEYVGFEDYTHLAFGFQVDEKWAGVLAQVSGYGTKLIQTLRNSGRQRDARIAVVRVVEIQGRLDISVNDNLKVPAREIWYAVLATCSAAGTNAVLPRLPV